MGSRGLSSVNLNHLVALDALLAEGSVARAAKRIGISPSALSHTLSALRDLFDDPLLIRGREGMVLTPAAQRLVGPLRTSLRDLERLLDQGPSFNPATSRREFTVATGDFVAGPVASTLLRSVSAVAPNISLSIRSLDFARCMDALERGEIDVLLGPQLGGGESVETQAWAQDPFVCVVRSGHAEIDEGLDLPTYARLPHLLISPTGRGTSAVDDLLAEHGLSRRVLCRASTFLVAPTIVANSELILTAPRSAVEAFADSLGLRILQPPIPLEPLRLYMAWHRRDTDDPAHQWLRERLTEARHIRAS